MWKDVGVFLFEKRSSYLNFSSSSRCLVCDFVNSLLVIQNKILLKAENCEISGLSSRKFTLIISDSKSEICDLKWIVDSMMIVFEALKCSLLQDCSKFNLFENQKNLRADKIGLLIPKFK